MSDDNHERLAEREDEMPLALILADNLEKQVLIGEAKYYLDGDAADELRRLHTQHQADQERIKELESTIKAFNSYIRDEQMSTDGAVNYSTTAINHWAFLFRDLIAKAGEPT